MAEKRKRTRAAGTRRTRGDEARWALAVHGGAGAVPKAGLDADDEAAVRAALTAALQAGARALAAGAASLDVVEQAVCALEDSPLFNAGKGAVFNARGEHELEASIMDGRTLKSRRRRQFARHQESRDARALGDGAHAARVSRRRGRDCVCAIRGHGADRARLLLDGAKLGRSQARAAARRARAAIARARHGGCGRARFARQPSGGDFHGRNHREQARGPRRRFVRHRGRHVREQRMRAQFRARGRASTSCARRRRATSARSSNTASVARARPLQW